MNVISFRGSLSTRSFLVTIERIKESAVMFAHFELLTHVANFDSLKLLNNIHLFPLASYRDYQGATR